jgi:sugar-specific transcriptional regulator TrmB
MIFVLITNELANIIDDLKSFGLTSLEARVYLSLNQCGIMSANQIAKDSKIARAEVYRILNDLVEKEVVKERLGRPRLYESIPPNDMMETLIGNLERRVKDMQKSKQQLSEYLFLKRKIGFVENPTEQFELIRTLPRIIEEITSSLLIVENEVLVINDEPSLMSGEDASDDYESALKSAVERGVKFRVIAEVNHNTLSLVKKILEYSEVRHSDYISFTLLIFDGKKMIIGSSLVKEKRFKDKTDISTNSQEFVDISKSHFNNLWGMSIDAKHIISDLES